MLARAPPPAPPLEGAPPRGLVAIREGNGAPSLRPSSSTRGDIARMFKAHDAGDKGWLTREDLACAFASLTGHEPSDAELDLVRGRCPRGEVDLRHFAAYMEDRLASRAASPAERCRAVFGAFDARRVGFITLTDALAAFALAAPRVPAVVVEDLFREADEDGDGRVGFDAFARVYFGADECPSPGRGR